jgi:hypothetical protein
VPIFKNQELKQKSVSIVMAVRDPPVHSRISDRKIMTAATLSCQCGYITDPAPPLQEPVVI